MYTIKMIYYEMIWKEGMLLRLKEQNGMNIHIYVYPQVKL